MRVIPKKRTPNIRGDRATLRVEYVINVRARGFGI